MAFVVLAATVPLSVDAPVASKLPKLAIRTKKVLLMSEIPSSGRKYLRAQNHNLLRFMV
jgi:hypothetical protein